MVTAVGQGDDSADAPGEGRGINAHWLRLHYRPAFDPTFRIIASRTGTRLCEVLALWGALIDHAALARPRGSIAGFDVEGTAMQLEIAEETIDSILTEMAKPRRDKRGLIDGDMLAHGQPRPSTERTRRWRERHRSNGGVRSAGSGGGDGKSDDAVTVATKRRRSDRPA
jgi:hypothetical protein